MIWQVTKRSQLNWNLGIRFANFIYGVGGESLEKELPPEWLHVIPKSRDMFNDLPLNRGKLLYELWKELPCRITKPDEKRIPLERLRDFVLRSSKDWERYVEFYSDPGIPWTNNRTEQTIGRLKNRAKRVSGYKSVQGLQLGSVVASQFLTKNYEIP